ncbi:hypothetical protein [Planctomycetes bacterium K23_9]|uniref:Flagellar FliJ protein n=1 Tax=Stieleria marina TaxID=1930275 RepID=A0A517NVL2_9BACT|nr:hypothetical protein K239x_31670 [Planctomycetes bacterium K23_9]
MSVGKQKITRVQRLQSIEENKLNALSVELAVVQAELAKLHEKAQSVQSAINSATLPDDAHQVESHQQSLVWLSHLEKQLQSIAAKVTESEAIRDDTLQRMIAQKVKVNGWEKLTDRMQTELDHETQAVESLDADDRYLNNPVKR